MHARPKFSTPFGAAIAIILLYLFWGLTLPVAGLAIGWSMLGYDPVMQAFIPLVALIAVPIIAVALGMRNGQPWSLRLFRLLAVLGVAALAGDVVAGLLLTFGMIGSTRHDYLSGEFLLMASAVLAVLVFLIFRALRRVRWLDPYSTPEEWEPPVRRARRRA